LRLDGLVASRREPQFHRFLRPLDLPVDERQAISRYRDDGTLEQLDRGGNPAINPFINPDGEKNLYNSRQPADDVANYLAPRSKILGNADGCSSPVRAQQAQPGG
jgi:Domain of unknown function (DUF4331)